MTLSRSSRRRLLALAAAVAVLAGGGTFLAVELIGDGDEADTAPTTVTEPPTVPPRAGEPRTPTSTSTTVTAPEVPIASVPLRVTRVATVPRAVALAVAPDGGLLVASRSGTVEALGPGDRTRTVLDLSEDVTQTASDFAEQGLLGIAVSPDGGRLYVDYTDRDGDTRVEEFTWGADGPDPASRRTVLTVDQPHSNHNGGHLAFGRDGALYVSLGDGGGRGDPEQNAQNLGTLLGTILRIDPRPQGDAPYAVPGDNPFVGVEGARPEIWAYGLRNPWRFSFDRATGDLWIGDVGQNRYEEIDFEPAGSGGGRNYGWDRLEGRHPFEGEPPADHVLPVHEYPLTGGACAVVGGFVYRGSAIPELRGVYVFADTCQGEVMGLRLGEGGVADEVASLGANVELVSSFGEGPDGELYALSVAGDGGIFRFERDG